MDLRIPTGNRAALHRALMVLFGALEAARGETGGKSLEEDRKKEGRWIAPLLSPDRGLHLQTDKVTNRNLHVSFQVFKVCVCTWRVFPHQRIFKLGILN